MKQIKQKKFTYQKRQQIIDDLRRLFQIYIKTEYQKIIELIDTTYDVPRFITNKWIEVHDESGGSCNINKEIRFKTSMLRSYICDYSDAYIVIKETITVKLEKDGAIDGYNRNLILKSNTPLLTAYQKSIMFQLTMQKTFGTQWNYTRDIPVDTMTNSESFKYKISIIGKTADDDNTKEVEIPVPLKYLGNFWKTLDMPLIDNEVNNLNMV